MEKITLSITAILNDLRSGLERPEIAKKYGLNQTQLKRAFQHSKLKGKKTIKPKEEVFVLEDDTEDDTEPEVVVTAMAEAENPNQLTIDSAIAEAENTEVPAPVEDAYSQPEVVVVDDTNTSAAPLPSTPPPATTQQGQW